MNLRRWHRLIGLVVGLPCLLWGLSGALLAWKNWAGPPPPAAIRGAAPRSFRVPIERVLQALGREETPERVEWRHVAGAPRYLVRFSVPPLLQVVDGESGQVLALPWVGEPLARQIGLADAPPGVEVKGCVRQTAGTLVYPSWNELPAFRVTLTNGDDVYVSPTTGEILEHVDPMFRAIRISFYGLHVWKFLAGGDSQASYLVLLCMGLVLAAAGATGLWLGLGLGGRRRR